MRGYKYVMIVTSEDEKYEKGETDLSFYACEPWKGLLEEVIYGNNAEELYGDGKREGLFYQLYETETGKRIGYGTIDPDYPREDIEEWEKQKLSQDLVVETPIEKLWEYVCRGDTEGLKGYFQEDFGVINRRYNKFGESHSLIMGAFRNNQFETVRFLVSIGETITTEEHLELQSKLQRIEIMKMLVGM